MWTLLKHGLAGWRSNRPEECTQAPLFSGSAYFSKRVPRLIIESWVTHGGHVSSGTTLDPRARYFFAMDPSEQWVTKLFAKSVTVIHAGWIVHCVNESFRVAVSKYVLDDSFVPGPPYKLTGGLPQAYVPLSSQLDPLGSSDAKPGEPALSSLTSPSGVQSSDTPSTPPKISRKRKREQAYYDSPSGSLVFSAFDKDGMPRRPTKQRKLRFDPSFSPQNGRCGTRKDDAGKRSSVDWVKDFLETFGDDDENVVGEVDQQSVALKCRGGVNFVRSPGTPSKPFRHNGSPARPRRFIAAETGSKPSLSPLKTTTSATPMKVKVNHPLDKSPLSRVPTIDFTNPPRSTQRWRFQDSRASATTFQNLISAVNTDTVDENTVDEKSEVKTPKKISFSDHAQIRVYTVSPPPPTWDVNLKKVATTVQNGSSNEIAGDENVKTCTKIGFADRAQVRVYAMDASSPELGANEAVEPRVRLGGITGATADGRIKTRTLDTAVGSSGIPTQTPDTRMVTGRSEDDALTLTVEDVQAMRRRLIELDAKNRDGVGGAQLATVFEIGKRFRGMKFRHVR